MTRLFLILCPLFFLSVNQNLIGEDGDPGFAIELKVEEVGEDLEPRISRTSGVDLERSSKATLPVRLSHSPSPVTVELGFDLDRGSVYVRAKDLRITPNKEGESYKERGYFEAELFFEWEKEIVLWKNEVETVSLKVSGPVVGEGGGNPGWLSPEEVSALEGALRVERGRIFGTVYNPGAHFIKELQVRVTSPVTDGSAGIDRVYSCRVGIPTLSSDDFQIDSRLPILPEGTEYQVKIEKASK